MARRADLFLHPKPGTDLVWLSAITRYLLDNGQADAKFLEQWVNGLEQYRKTLEPFTMEAASRICGLPVETLKTVAQMIAAAKSMCVLWAMGVTQHNQGSDTVDRHLQSASRNGKLHAPGNRGLSDAGS